MATFNAAPANARDLIRASAWPPEEWDNLVSVIGCECPSWNPQCWNQSGEDSRGWMQINVGPGAHTQWADRDLFDPATNLATGFELWSAQGWGPWSCARKLGITAAVPGSGGPGPSAGVTMPQLGGAWWIVAAGVVAAVVWGGR